MSIEMEDSGGGGASLWGCCWSLRISPGLPSSPHHPGACKTRQGTWQEAQESNSHLQLLDARETQGGLVTSQSPALGLIFSLITRLMDGIVCSCKMPIR